MCEPKGEMTALVTGGAAISAARWRMTFPMAANSSRRAGTGQLDDHAANFAAHATAVAGHDVCGWQPCDLPRFAQSKALSSRAQR